QSIRKFSDTIDKVKENTEFYWRYQRYSFIREYFEQPPCAYPPLIIVPHIMLLIRYIYLKLSCKGNEDNDHTSESITLLRNFKMIAVANTTSERWDAFEYAATHNYARSKIEKATKNDLMISNDYHSYSTTSMNEYDQQRKMNEIDKQMQDLSQKVNILVIIFSIIYKDLVIYNEVTESLQWMKDTMARVKMNDRNKEPLLLTSTSVGDSNISILTQPIENSY
ncbi:unnamed protein product, partial [Adineta steineri]